MACQRQPADGPERCVEQALLLPEGLRLLRSAVAARPRSTSGQREPLDLRYEPQTPLPPGSVVERTPRSDEGDEDDDDYAA